MSSSVLRFLQSPPWMMNVLLYLLERDEARASELMEDLGLRSKTYYAAVRRMKELGFVYLRGERGFPSKAFIGLTVKGREVAEHLRPVSQILEDTLLGLESELEALEVKERKEKENRRMLDILTIFMDTEFSIGEWNASEAHAKRALNISSALGDSNNTARALRLLGEIHHRRGMLEESEKEFGESIRTCVEVKDLRGASEGHYFLGAVKEKRGELEEALKEYEESRKLAESSKEDTLQAKAGLGIGRVLGRRGRYEESLERFKESIETFERLDEIDELPRAYTSAGASAFSLDVGESLGWHEKCVKLARMTGDVRMLGTGLSNAAGCLIMENEAKKAEEYLEEAFEIFRNLDEKDMLVSVHIQMGRVSWMRKKWTDSEHHFYRALDIAKKHGFPYETGDTLLNVGLMNIDRGRKVEAKDQLKRALEVFEGLDNRAKINEIQEALARINR
ncbi:MAG: tetratricopeptide repeat protein [Thermoplasmata archaeon]